MLFQKIDDSLKCANEPDTIPARVRFLPELQCCIHRIHCQRCQKLLIKITVNGKFLFLALLHLFPYSKIQAFHNMCPVYNTWVFFIIQLFTFFYDIVFPDRKLIQGTFIYYVPILSCNQYTFPFHSLIPSLRQRSCYNQIDRHRHKQNSADQLDQRYFFQNCL